jgi:hypothetical protein
MRVIMRSLGFDLICFKDVREGSNDAPTGSLFFGVIVLHHF